MPTKKTSITPPSTDEAAEAKLIALAFAQAQKELENQTASSQVVSHFLKLGSQRAQVELAKLELENRLLEEKIAAERSGAQINEMFTEVMAALKSYTVSPPGVDDDYF